MALVAPVAPKNFYEDGLTGLKTALEQVNGSSSGRVALISALPADIEAAWAEVGVGGDASVGTVVLGYADLQAISAVIAGDAEGAGENGYKLTFDAIPGVGIDTTSTSIALALLVGRDTFAGGSDADVRYIVDMTDLAVTSGVDINLPTFDVEIQYGTNKP